MGSGAEIAENSSGKDDDDNDDYVFRARPRILDVMKYVTARDEVSSSDTDDEYVCRPRPISQPERTRARSLAAVHCAPQPAAARVGESTSSQSASKTAAARVGESTSSHAGGGGIGPFERSVKLRMQQRQAEKSPTLPQIQGARRQVATREVFSSSDDDAYVCRTRPGDEAGGGGNPAGN